MLYHQFMEQRKNSLSVFVIISFILLGAAGMLLAAARNVPGFAEWYSVNIYALITASVGRLSGAVPFSVAEAAVCILPFIIIADIIRCRRRLRPALARILLLASVLFFLYAANCGVNYHRNSFADRSALKEAQFTEDQLADFCGYIISQIEECSEGTDYPQGRALADEARKAMAALAEEQPALRGYYPVPKQLSVLSGAFSAMGVSGIYSPFTVEANINGRMPDMEKPFTACHELSHLRGYMNEGEANYIGWLACTGSDDPSFRRSGWLLGWMYAGGTLKRVDPERYDSLCKRLPPDAAAELDENSLFWSSHETRASEVQDRINDAYLKANDQKEGIQSYGMLTTLMLMHYLEADTATGLATGTDPVAGK